MKKFRFFKIRKKIFSFFSIKSILQTLWLNYAAPPVDKWDNADLFSKNILFLKNQVQNFFVHIDTILCHHQKKHLFSCRIRLFHSKKKTVFIQNQVKNLRSQFHKQMVTLSAETLIFMQIQTISLTLKLMPTQIQSQTFLFIEAQCCVTISTNTFQSDPVSDVFDQRHNVV